MVLKVAVSPDEIHGDADEGYGKVADAFRANFAAGHEIGAAVTVYRDGDKVVDMWGGYRHGVTKQPWQHDTIVNMFSTTKGIASLAIAVAVSRGLISYEAKVADYWPQFAQAGKADITVRQLLAHQAGLPALRLRPSLADVADTERLSAILAAQPPAWTPGERHGYHAITLGWYESELLRHADPAHRTLGRYFADELATPLGLDLHIGLPDNVSRDRIAFLHGFARQEMLLHLNVMPPTFVLALLNPSSLSARAFGMPTGLKRSDDLNREDLRVVEIPASNGHGTARAVASAYGTAATGGTRLGLTGDVLEALHTPVTTPRDGRKDMVLRIDTSFSLGFFKPFPQLIFGSSDKAFGTPGLGGSFGFADPDTGVGFGYVPNRLGFHPWSDPRELAIRRALFQDVLGARLQV